MRPTKRHFLAKSAELAHSAENELLANSTEYEKMLYLLARHKKDLKDIQSREKKAEFKKSILPDYLPWIEGALNTGNGKQDNVLMTWQVWAIDCGQFNLALSIADYALHQQLALPEPFARTLGTMLAEEFADYAKAAQLAGKDFEVSYLERVAELVKDEDMPDESRARLYRELGLLKIESDPETALATLERALELNQNIGVKGEVKKLRKQLNKPDDDSQDAD
ncbi:phage terminase small subunit [Actinobacillus porcinus]|uniref:phage terminase small subunit n=1 Tax=Actinobacillus porcinus TaxID=51048 RepID=UPI002355FC01|nr:phage terminase small subunit [Actinobacillus porcinus]MCI5763307.1 phage terminase small subunit [Actinobacillus porcinus]MDY5421163.1 phage terminase small subunit [Actinobacillus porcinus]